MFGEYIGGFRWCSWLTMLHQQVSDSMRAWRARKDSSRRSVVSKYNILGFISSGTYGRVYKATGKDEL